jgi:hypothetical protein
LGKSHKDGRAKKYQRFGRHAQHERYFVDKPTSKYFNKILLFGSFLNDFAQKSLILQNIYVAFQLISQKIN